MNLAMFPTFMHRLRSSQRPGFFHSRSDGIVSEIYSYFANSPPCFAPVRCPGNISQDNQALQNHSYHPVAEIHTEITCFIDSLTMFWSSARQKVFYNICHDHETCEEIRAHIAWEKKKYGLPVYEFATPNM